MLGTWSADELKAGAWPKELELHLLRAMAENKPVGVHAHFCMVAIYASLQKYVPKITTAAIWDHMNTLYDLGEIVRILSHCIVL